MEENREMVEAAGEAPTLARIVQDESSPDTFEGCGTGCHPTGRCRPKA